MNEQAPMMNQQQHQQHLMNLNANMMSMNQMSQQPQPQMVTPMNRGYGMWPQPPQFQTPNPNPGAMKPSLSFKKSLGPRSNWKAKKVNKPNDKRRNSDQQKFVMAGSRPGVPAGSANIISGSGSGSLVNMNFNSYQPPTLNELQHQNRLKARKFFQKKKYNSNNTSTNMNMNMNVGSSYNNFNNSRTAPYAPRNTTSFIIRAKKSGGIASLVSPSPMTPAVLPTPIFSPSREVLVDMAKEEWGVDGYGSMKGLIRLRSPGHEMEAQEEDEEDDGGSSESDVEEHVEVERRLDHDLSRFEMLYDPNSAAAGMDFHSVLENRVDDQDSHIAHLEDENLILKERLFLMERELGDLRRRMQFLERGNRGGVIINEEVVENESENESGSRGEDNNEDFSEENTRGSKGKSGDDHYSEVETTEKNEGFGFERGVEKEFDMVCRDGEAFTKVSNFESTGENNKDDGHIDLNNKNGIVFDFGKEAENKDVMIREADENSKVIETKCEDENKIDESLNADKVEGNNMVAKDGDRNNNHDENKCVDMTVTVLGTIDTESSEPVVAGGDICMEEPGDMEDITTVLLTDASH